MSTKYPMYDPCYNVSKEFSIDDANKETNSFQIDYKPGSANFSVEIKDETTGPWYNRVFRKTALGATIAYSRRVLFIFEYVRLGHVQCIGVRNTAYLWLLGNNRGVVSLLGFPLFAWIPAPEPEIV